MPETGREINLALIQHDSHQSGMVSEMLNCLREPSYNTFFAGTLSAGLELLATHQIDLIFLDPEIPDSKGLDALAIIRRAPPTPKPVVALIRDGDEQLCRDVISEGASDYLVKGKFDDAMLGRVLHRVMLRWEAGWRLYPTRGNFRNLVEMSPVGMIVKDSSGTVHFANSAATTMLGRSYHEVVDQSLDLNVLDGASIEMAIRNTGGEPGTGEAVATATIWDNNPARLIMVQNITQRRLAEEELRLQSEIIKNMAEGIMVVRARDWAIVYTNSEFDEMFGYGPGELVGKNVSVVNAPGERDPEEVAREIITVLAQRGEWKGEVHNVKKDGTPFWCYNSVSTFDHWDHGTVWVSIHSDITERKEAEEAIQESEAGFRSLLNSTPDGIVIVNSDARIQLVNTQTERMFGYRRQELLDQPVEILLPERLAAGHVQLRSGYIASPTARPMGTGLETVGRHKDGSEFPVDISLSPLETDDGLLVISAIRDATERKQAEKALQDREERFRKLLNSTPDAIVIVNNEARIQLVNAQTERMFGYNLQELLDQPVEILLPERLARGHVQLRSEYIANPTARPMGTGLETIGRRKDGSEFPVDISLSPLETENGGLVISAIRDITERKRAEDERARLAAIVDSSEDAIIGKTLEGIIISWNKGAERIYGYSAEEVLGRPGGFLAPPDSPDEVPEMLRRAGQGETVDHFDTKRIRKDGALIDVSLTVSPVMDSSGKVVGASSIAHDIVNRKKAEDALHESEERFRSLVQSASGAIIIADEEGRIISWNQGAQNIFGYAEEEVLGQPITQLMPERYREDHRRGLERVRRTGHGDLLGKTIELSALRKDGSEFPIQISLSSWQTEGRAFFSGMLHDITERRELEAALQTTNQELEQRVHQLDQANTDLERFAYVASHDLQEPLRMVSGFSQMLQEKYHGRLDAEADEYIWYLVDAANRMRDLIQDLLAFSRVQIRGASLERVNCEEVLGWALSNLHASVEEAQAVVTHDPLPEVMGDAAQLMLVFQNLLANAIKFRHLDPPRIQISAQDSGDEFIFSVSDNGIGIEPEFYQRIFEIFQRLHTRDRYPGTGIGLAICQRIIERHGGRIWLESEPGQGSTFYFSLPALQEPDDNG